MDIRLYTNGKINPIGVDFGELRLSVETELIGEIDKVCFKLYNSIDDVKDQNCVQEIQTKNLFVYVDTVNYKTAERKYWNAQIFIDGKEYCSDLSFFETGLKIDKENEQWIDNPNFNKYVSEFVKEFNLGNLPKKARLYIVGLGYYQSAVNGAKTDEYFLKPLLTDFDNRLNINNAHYDEDTFYNDKKSVTYDSFDILDKLKVGKNQLSVLLGTGWYCNDDKTFTDPSYKFGTPKLFFEIHLFYDDCIEVLKCDESVLVRNTARISQLFLGDREDFTAKQEKYVNARICTPPSGKLVFPNCNHDAITDELKPISETKHGNIVEYDFGVNHSGSIAISVQGQKGKKLKICYYEVKTDGKLNPHTSEWVAYDVSGAKPIAIDVWYQTDEYVLSGELDMIYPLFHFNCYRYVTVESDGAYDIESISSLFISTMMEKDSDFHCSDEFINKFYNAFILTQSDNMHSGVPSDCPHREKLPYTGDGDLASEPTLYSFKSQQFYRKWLDDVLASQGNNGWVPYTAPNIGGAGGYWWSNVITSLPLKLFSFCGDKKVIEKSFDAVIKYISFCNTAHDGDYIIRKSFIRWYLGEWLTPTPTELNVDFMNTLAFYKAVDNAVRMCEIIGKTEKKSELIILKDNIKNSVNKTFFNKETMHYADGVQGADLLPLVYGFVDKESDEIKQNLINQYKSNGTFDTGIIITPALLEALSEWGETELCYQLFTADKKPSFKKMLDGETTLCEAWNKVWPGLDEIIDDIGVQVSHCHPMFGSVVGWMYKYIAGLNLSELCHKKFHFYPKFINQVSSATAYKNTEYGQIFVSYVKTSSGIELKVKVPYGLNCEFTLDDFGRSEYVINGKKASNIINGKLSLNLTGGEYLITNKIQ